MKNYIKNIYNMTQNELKQIASECAQKIIHTQENLQFFSYPYKHLVIDDFFPIELANTVLTSFPDVKSDIWEKTNDEDIEIKLRTQWQSEFDIPEGIIDAIRILNSSLILKAMSKKFEIDKLIPDPYFTGGGLNATVKGGLLDVHVDGNYHDATGCNRRLNAIVYLNPNWREGWGGTLGYIIIPVMN
jgi:Rps23 Pro-64 3,4-dihydroxylase Tpa1-like proline 4-hydroxylase